MAGEEIDGPVPMPDEPDTKTEPAPAQERQRVSKRDPIRAFFFAVLEDDLETLQSTYANMGMMVNIQDPETKATALHYAVGYRHKDVLKWLIKFEELDYLIRDEKGRLPSAIAFEEADDPVIGHFLVKKEAQQAEERGIDLKTLFAS